VIEAARTSGYVTMITADHGNLEEMTNPDGTPHVSHTTNPVPFILLDHRSIGPNNLKDGILADVAPTILSALNIEQPLTMDGTSLAPGYDWGGRRKVLLIILDGWGIGEDDDSNPIFLARTPMWDDLTENAPHSILQAAGESVGLKEGKAGNSEAGHINIGAGRVVLQDDVRLDRAMQDGSFFTNEVLCNTIESVKERNGCLHLIGLLTEKSSHGSIDYPLAILRMAKDRGMRNVFLHMIFDGRSTEPGSAPMLVEKLDNELKEVGIGIIATGVGRGIALDRDGNYVKTKRAFDAMVSGTGRKFLAE
jgi:2,3-bisphosphoglycerate-independent phosphoglycerate mutase